MRLHSNFSRKIWLLFRYSLAVIFFFAKCVRSTHEWDHFSSVTRKYYYIPIIDCIIRIGKCTLNWLYARGTKFEQTGDRAHKWLNTSQSSRRKIENLNEKKNYSRTNRKWCRTGVQTFHTLKSVCWISFHARINTMA